MITFRRESLAQVKADIMGLLNAHWEEIARDKAVIKLDPHWEYYEIAEAAGRLHILTGREKGELVAYYVNLIIPHPHYQNSLTAYSDIFFLRSDLRKGLTGYRMLKEQERAMKKLGVQKIYTMEKVDHSIKGLWERAGYTHVENIYAKVI